MNILENVPLANHSTMRVGGTARYMAEITERAQLAEAVAWAEEHRVPLIMIGDGSNIIWSDEGFEGLLLINKIMRFEIFSEDEDNHYVTVGAGENWDKTVERIVQEGLSGVEQLSLIPGTVGATPVQNVGAYGQEIANILTTIEAYDIHERKLVTLPASDCEFGYRTSRFKTTDRNRFLISAITLHLTKQHLQPPFYESLQQYLGAKNITDYSPHSIRSAVIAIRSGKLPDPAIVANNGSFFANPVVPHAQITSLLPDYPGIKYWPQQNGMVKVSAAWLVENIGYKAFEDPETGMATWPFQSLVLVNKSAENTADVLKFKQKIVDTISKKFGITLQQEPELLP